jgi:hypothetical protein
MRYSLALWLLDRREWWSTSLWRVVARRTGLLDDLASMIGMDDDLVLLGFVRLLAMKKRKANKLPCPCGTGVRLGRCHNRKLNTLRDKLGRGWFSSLLHGSR